TTLPVTRIAYASGFQSLRRFNFVFRERYRMSPSALRRGRRPEKAPRAEHGNELVRLTLAYRAPLAWDALLGVLTREAIPGVEVVDRARSRYRRTVRLEGRSGIILVEDAPAQARNPAKKHLNVDVAATLLPVLMPLLARLRQLFDLDLEPLVVDAHLAQSGLADCVRERPGLRVPGALEGFEVVLRALLRERALVRRVVAALGEPLETGAAGLTRLVPSAQRVADAGASFLMAQGVGRRCAEAMTTAAHAMASGALRLEPGSDVAATRRALLEIEGIGDRIASVILMRALHWPDAFPASSRALRRQTGVASSTALRVLAEQWRPWRAYAALHLELRERRVRHAPNGQDIRAARLASLVS
ncbi:MAG: AlkA N-terminal domain-containing protein, partial [Steroidobacteraceae bacterium]